MKIINALVAASFFLGVFCHDAEARYWRGYYRCQPSAEESAKQARANMAERTHQMRERQELAKQYAEKQKVSGQSTIQYYGNNGRKVYSPRRGQQSLVQNRYMQ